MIPANSTLRICCPNPKCNRMLKTSGAVVGRRVIAICSQCKTRFVIGDTTQLPADRPALSPTGPVLSVPYDRMFRKPPQMFVMPTDRVVKTDGPPMMMATIILVVLVIILDKLSLMLDKLPFVRSKKKPGEDSPLCPVMPHGAVLPPELESMKLNTGGKEPC